jgi:hypothetical protein
VKQSSPGSAAAEVLSTIAAHKSGNAMVQEYIRACITAAATGQAATSQCSNSSSKMQWQQQQSKVAAAGCNAHAGTMAGAAYKQQTQTVSANGT